eukprot:4965845-Amphidinium_carterae.1
MSLEDHNLTDIMKDTKDMKTAIVDDHYIDHMPHQRGLGQEDEDALREKEIDRITREHQRDVTGPILRRNVELARRHRDDGPDGYLQTKQYLEYLIYHRITTHSQQKRENTLT